MASTNINFRENDEAPNKSLTFNFPGMLYGAVKKYGGDEVFNAFRSAAIVRLQSVARNASEAGEDDKSIIAKLEAWKPTIRAPGKPKGDKVAEMLASMSEEERAAIFARVNERRPAGAKPAPAAKPAGQTAPAPAARTTARR